MEEFELEPGETIQLITRRHWLVFVLELLPFLFAVFIPFLIPLLLSFVSANLPQGAAMTTFAFTLANPWVRFALGLWWLFTWTAAFVTFTRSYLDLWIVTSTRIAHIKQVGFFHRRVESFLLVRVQDITTEVAGLVPTIFGFGSVRVETAGDASRTFRMHGLPNPEEIRDLVIREIAALPGHSPTVSP